MDLFDKKFVYLEWDSALEGKEVFVADCLAYLRRRVINNDQSNFGRVVDSGLNYPFQTPDGLKYAMAYYDPNYECKRAYAQGKVIQWRNKGDDNWIVTSNPNWVDGCEYRVKPDKPKTSEQHKLRVYKCSDDTLHISPYCTMTDFLFEGTEEECKQYIKEHYCDRCAHQSCDTEVYSQFCQGFKKSKQEHKSQMSWRCEDCVYEERDFREEPCSECIFIAPGNKGSNWEPKKKPKKNRRMTNRELAKWLAQGNGQMRMDCTRFISWSYPSTNKEDDDTPVKEGIYIRAWDSDEWMEPEVEE